MKKLTTFCVGIGLLLLAPIGLARAADIGHIIRKNERAAAPAFTWQGLYIGGNVGLGAQDTSGARTASGVIAGLFPADQQSRPHGWVGGAQIGHNWQTGAFVYGLEADFDWSGIRRSNAATASLGGFTTSTTSARDLKWLSTVRARAGFTPFSHVLIYGTGGVAIGKVQSDVSQSINVGGCTFGCGSASNGATRTGWTAGGGIEAALNQRWSAKIEAIYYDLGSVTVGYTTPGVVPSTASFSSDYRGALVRAGINFRF